MFILGSLENAQWTCY